MTLSDTIDDPGYKYGRLLWGFADFGSVNFGLGAALLRFASRHRRAWLGLSCLIARVGKYYVEVQRGYCSRPERGKRKEKRDGLPIETC